MQDLQVNKSSLFAKVLLPSLLINVLSLAVPLTVLQIYDRILPNQSYGTASVLILGAFLAILMETFLRFVRSWLLAAAASNSEQATYISLIHKLSAASFQQLQRMGAGKLSEGILAVSKVKEFYSGGLLVGLIDFPFAIIFLSLVYYIGGVLVLIPLTVWVVALLIVLFTSYRIKSLSRLSAESDVDRRVFLGGIIATLQGIKRQAIESRIFTQFKQHNQLRYFNKTQEEQKAAFAQESIQLAALATSVIFVIVGSLWVLNGELTAGGLAACSILAARAVAPLSVFIGIRVKLNNMESARDAIQTLMATTTPVHTSSLNANFKQVEFSELQVRFYRQQYRLDAQIERGEIILLHSEQLYLDSYMLACLAGAGELYDGDILIDGSLSPLTALTSSVAFCPAKGELIAGSLLDNLCGFNTEHATQALDYAFQLGLDRIITKLPEGVETQIGHRHSVPLSMGSVKRICLVAQFARAQPVLMLDRPDVGLDLDSIQRLTNTIQNEAAQGRTVFMVTYHPQLMALADKTLNVDQEAAGMTR